MNRFLIKISVFLLITYYFSYSLQRIIDYGLKKSNFSSEYKEWNDLYNSNINADIVIQGSSRAFVHFSPKVLEDSLRLSVYNLGMDGCRFNIQNYRFQEYLEHNKKPDMILQAIDVNTFSEQNIEYNYTQFIPYFNDEFRKQFEGKGVFKKKDFLLPLYKFSHSPGIISESLKSLLKNENLVNEKYKGFKVVDRHWEKQAYKIFRDSIVKHSHYAILDKSFFLFETFVRFCKNNDIRLILIYTPEFKIYQNSIVNKTRIQDLFKKVAIENGALYLDYSFDPICDDTSMFYNPNHLNKKGVEVFNKILVSDLKKILK